MKYIEYGRSRIEVKQIEFKDRKFIDVRKYYPDNETDEWKPTRKGIAIPLDQANKIANFIKEVNK